jgi:hypothetical protein
MLVVLHIIVVLTDSVPYVWVDNLCAAYDTAIAQLCNQFL